MKSSPVPFRILGRHNGNLIILRSYPDHVAISTGGETHSFPSLESAMSYLQEMTRRNRKGVSYEHTHRKNIHSGSTEKAE